MSKLQPLANTVVHLTTQAEYDEYMQLAEEAGWRWATGRRPTDPERDYAWFRGTNVKFLDVSEVIATNTYAKTIYSLPELKAKFGIGTKTQPEQWHYNESYTKSGHTLYPDKIKLASGKEYTPAELQAELNLLRSISKAHKKFFPSAK